MSSPNPPRRRAERRRGSRRQRPPRRPRKGLVHLAEVVLVVVIIAAVAAALFAASLGGDDQATATSDPETVAATPEPEAPSAAPPPPQEIVQATPLKRAPRTSTTTERVRDRAEELARKAAAEALPAVIRVGSFNILGSQHTGKGGDKGGGWPDGGARLPGAIERIKAHGVSVVGLQEAQLDQLSGLVAGTGFAEYPGPQASSANRVNTILYDPHVFELVDASTFMMSNGTGLRAQPIVRLRHIESGKEIYVVNAHPPAGRSSSLRAKRTSTMNQLVGVLNQLKQEGLPILLTGDMNDREAFVQHVIRPAGLVSSTSLSGRLAVDWVVGTPDVAFSEYTRDESTINRRISDHFFVAATATID